jgi:hypothetical protein
MQSARKLEGIVPGGFGVCGKLIEQLAKIVG